jgi:hypothetical protein
MGDNDRERDVLIAERLFGWRRIVTTNLALHCDGYILARPEQEIGGWWQPAEDGEPRATMFWTYMENAIPRYGADHFAALPALERVLPQSHDGRLVVPIPMGRKHRVRMAYDSAPDFASDVPLWRVDFQTLAGRGVCGAAAPTLAWAIAAALEKLIGVESWQGGEPHAEVV